MTLHWDEFVARYRSIARNVAAGITGGGADVDDLVQEAMTALFSSLRRNPTRFESIEHARNYFLKTVRNLAIKERRRAPTLPMEQELPAEGPQEGNELLAEHKERLAAALRSLEDDERDLITRRFHRRETLAQIASATGVPVSTLHSREKALLARLRRTLGGGDPFFAPHQGERIDETDPDGREENGK